MFLAEFAEGFCRCRDTGNRRQRHLPAANEIAIESQRADLVHEVVLGRQKLVHWRVQKANRDGIGSHDLEQLDEVRLLDRQQLRQCSFPLLFGVRQDHVDNDRQAVAGVEHPLGAAQPDAHGAIARGPGLRPPACRRWP